MELEPIYIPIHKVDNVRHAYLGLEGTILLFDQRQAAIDSEFLIPVELVTISEGHRFESRWLMAAALSLLVPVFVWFAYRQIQHRKQPREYREALRYYLRGDYGRTIEVLEALRDRLPDYLPTYFSLAQAYVRESRFDEAVDVMSRVADDYPDAAQLMERNIWLFKRIDQRRREAL